MKLKSNYHYYTFIFCLLAAQTNQHFLPVKNDSESIFLYEIVGTGLSNNVNFGFDSHFNLHISLYEELKYLINITNSTGKIGNKEWPTETLNALEQPFYIALNNNGTPIQIEYDLQLETNYSLFRKQLIFNQFKEIYNEHQKYHNLKKKVFFSIKTIPSMPFGECETKINITTSDVYTNIDYEATANQCEGTIDPFYTLDMNVEVYPQSEFRKTFAFSFPDFEFQYVRLDARLKLITEPEIDVNIYSLITFNGMKSILDDVV